MSSRQRGSTVDISPNMTMWCDPVDGNPYPVGGGVRDFCQTPEEGCIHYRFNLFLRDEFSRQYRGTTGDLT
jgi:hypothetical protein